MLPLADFLGPETFVFLVPICALLIPIIAILTKHQIKMAAIIHGRTVDEHNNVIAVPNNNSQLSEDVRQLRELMHQQAIALDSLRDEVRASHSIQDRVNQNS